MLDLGSKQTKNFKSTNPKIIDYANSEFRSEFMDIYLGAKCSFCISTGYGPDMLPYIFNKPIGLMALPLGTLDATVKEFYF